MNIENEVEVIDSENTAKSALPLDAIKGQLDTIINMLYKLGTMLGDGFNNVNKRLDALEGKEGMHGIHQKISQIKRLLQEN